MDIIQIKDKNYRKVTEPRVLPNSYFVSEDGEVYSILSDRIIQGSLDKDGYRRYYLNGINNKHICVGAHRLVAWEFIPNPNNYPIPDHIDGNKLNNHFSNLEWVTVKENTHRAEKLGLRKIRGDDNGNSKYSEEFIRFICSEYEKGNTLMGLFRLIKGDNTAQHLDDPALYQLLHSIKKRKLWQDIVKDYEYSTEISSSGEKIFKADKTYCVFNENEIHKICKLFQDGYSIQDVLEVFVGSRNIEENKKVYSVISTIRRRKVWRYISDKYEFGKATHPIIENEFYKLAAEGYSLKDMKKLYGIHKRVGYDKIIRKMERAIKKYNKISQIPKNTNITIQI